MSKNKIAPNKTLEIRSVARQMVSEAVKEKMKTKKNTPEKQRGKRFFQKIQMWRILFDSTRPMNKQVLAQIVYKTQKTTEAQKRSVQRTADSLVSLGVAVKCDREGNTLTERELLKKLKNNPSEERFWMPNPEWRSHAEKQTQTDCP